MDSYIKNLLNAFALTCPTDIKWGHAVNNPKRLIEACANPDIHMLECDVCLGNLELPDGRIKENQVILSHYPLEKKSKLKFSKFIKVVKHHNSKVRAQGLRANRKGIKIDIKQIECLSSVLQTLRETPLLDLPIVWLNADILPGPGRALQKHVSQTEFINQSLGFDQSSRPEFPKNSVVLGPADHDFLMCAGLVISFGWSAGLSLFPRYTPSMMLAAWQVVEQCVRNSSLLHVSIAIRADSLLRSQQDFKELIDKVPVSLSVWRLPLTIRNEKSQKNLEACFDYLGRHRIFYDGSNQKPPKSKSNSISEVSSHASLTHQPTPTRLNGVSQFFKKRIAKVAPVEETPFQVISKELLLLEKETTTSISSDPTWSSLSYSSDRDNSP